MFFRGDPSDIKCRNLGETFKPQTTTIGVKLT